MTARKKKTASTSYPNPEQESVLRLLQKAFERRGIQVRRENLARGAAFRVKSGNCTFSGEKFVFVDRRLSTDQQMSVLLDHVAEFQVVLAEEELRQFPSSAQDLLRGRKAEMSPSVEAAA